MRRSGNRFGAHGFSVFQTLNVEIIVGPREAIYCVRVLYSFCMYSNLEVDRLSIVLKLLC